jgi:hypothetical protein
MGVTDSLTVATKPNVPRWTFDAQLPGVEAAGTIDDDTWFHMARWFEGGTRFPNCGNLWNT